MDPGIDLLDKVMVFHSTPEERSSHEPAWQADTLSPVVLLLFRSSFPIWGTLFYSVLCVSSALCLLCLYSYYSRNPTLLAS